MSAIFSVTYSILAFGIVLGIIVLVHEFGHFVAARLMGVRVETFSFGFGKRIFGKKIGETDFRLSLLPLGGYVKMAGEEEWDPDNLKPDEFQAKNRGQKIFILIAGPLMNIFLAFFIFTIINISGVETEAYKNEPPRIGYVEKGSPAQEADIRPGDLIRSINGTSIADWKSLDLTIGASPDEKVDVVVERNGEELKKEIHVKTISSYNVGDAGLQWNYQTEVAEVAKSSPAEEGGMKEGDIITGIDNTPLTYFEFSDRVNAAAGQPIKLNILRGDESRETLSLEVIPKEVYLLESPPLETEKDAREFLKNARDIVPGVDFNVSWKNGKYKVTSRDKESKEDFEKLGDLSKFSVQLSLQSRWIIGISMVPYTPMVKKHYGMFPAMGKSVRDIVNLTVLVFKTFKKMIVGKLSPKNLSGPIEIAKFSSKAMESGASNFFMLIAFISLQLGIVNLFPIPALDGGHLMIYSIESIIRKDFSLKVKGILMNIGFFLLISLMVFVILNDIAKTLPNGWSSFLPF